MTLKYGPVRSAVLATAGFFVFSDTLASS